MNLTSTELGSNLSSKMTHLIQTNGLEPNPLAGWHCHWPPGFHFSSHTFRGAKTDDSFGKGLEQTQMGSLVSPLAAGWFRSIDSFVTSRWGGWSKPTYFFFEIPPTHDPSPLGGVDPATHPVGGGGGQDPPPQGHVT